MFNDINKKKLSEGFKDGIPIGLGYFAVAFSLGIVARNAGISYLEGFIASLFTSASAGEYAVFTLIGEGASYIGIAIMTLVANARYFLMSCSLVQKLDEKETTIKRIGMGFGVTDEIFAISIAQKGKLNPFYFFGAMISAIFPWAIGTSCGILMGNILPSSIVSALGVALYGMFIAIVIPPAKENKTIAIAVFSSFVLSYLASITPLINKLSSGNRIIILTVIISTVFALIKPVEGDNL